MSGASLGLVGRKKNLPDPQIQDRIKNVKNTRGHIQCVRAVIGTQICRKHCLPDIGQDLRKQRAAQNDQRILDQLIVHDCAFLLGKPGLSEKAEDIPESVVFRSLRNLSA